MQYQYNHENIPFNKNQPVQPPLFNVNLPDGAHGNQTEGGYYDPSLNFNVTQQNQIQTQQNPFPPTNDNSFVNNSFTAPLMHPPPNYSYPIQNAPNMLYSNPPNLVQNNVQMQMYSNPPNLVQNNVQMQMYSPSMPSQSQNYEASKGNDGYAVGQTVNVVDALIPKTGFEKLMVPGIFVKQKMEWLEIFSGCETENKYKVYACDVAGNKEGHPLFKCKEKSSCVQRQCFPGDCRKFKLEVAHDSEGKFSLDGEMFLELSRPFKLTCLCFQRPYIEVNYKEGGKNEFIGRIVHNFDLCNMSMTLFDKTNTERYKIKGSVFQIGLMNQRGCPCKGCQQAFCFIHDNTGEIVGIIEKRGKGFKGMISDADNFSILFPIRSTLEERACILAATLFLDFRYFEDNENNRNNSYF